jgi:transposase
MSLVQSQTVLKNRIHAVLHRHGVINEHGDLFGVAGRKWLGEMMKNKDRRLPSSALQVLSGNLQLLDQLRRMIAQVTAELRRQLQTSDAGERLRSIPGIGWVLGYTILAEIGDINRFPDARHLASYSLLAPRAYDSAPEKGELDSPRGRHVGKVGRRTLKWAFIEAAHTAIRRGGRFRNIYDRRTNHGKRDRNRGIIAVAHELCRLSYIVWKKNVRYRDRPPARPGSEKRQLPTCSGTGQSDVAMIVAE